MESDRYSKKIAKSLGIKTNIMQQSFLIPCKDDDTSGKKAKLFLDYCLKQIDHYRLNIAMLDVGFIPRGNRNAFNHNEIEDYYMVSFAFEGNGIPSYQLIDSLFHDFSTHCYYNYSGRIHLTKNVHCPPELLLKMYKNEWKKLLKTKEIYDPNSLLQSHFFTNRFDYKTQNSIISSSKKKFAPVG